MPDRSLFDAWKIADEHARAAEADLKEKFTAFQEGGGPQPAIGFVLEVKLKRAKATERLDKYIRSAGNNSHRSGDGWKNSD